MALVSLYDFWKNLQTPKPEWEEFEKISTNCLVETETLIAAWRQQKAIEKYNSMQENVTF
jgi:hypothetical protein